VVARLAIDATGRRVSALWVFGPPFLASIRGLDGVDRSLFQKSQRLPALMSCTISV